MAQGAKREKRAKELYDLTVRRMTELGVYRKEYDGTIEVYAQMCQQYELLTERFENSRYSIQTKSAQGGMKKAPIVSALEALRKDILSYSDRLCLNPKSFDSMSIKPADDASKLTAALKLFDGKAV